MRKVLLVKYEIWKKYAEPNSWTTIDTRFTREEAEKCLKDWGGGVDYRLVKVTYEVTI